MFNSMMPQNMQNMQTKPAGYKPPAQGFYGSNQPAQNVYQPGSLAGMYKPPTQPQGGYNPPSGYNASVMPNQQAKPGGYFSSNGDFNKPQYQTPQVTVNAAGVPYPQAPRPQVNTLAPNNYMMPSHLANYRPSEQVNITPTPHQWTIPVTTPFAPQGSSPYQKPVSYEEYAAYMRERFPGWGQGTRR